MHHPVSARWPSPCWKFWPVLPTVVYGFFAALDPPQQGGSAVGIVGIRARCGSGDGRRRRPYVSSYTTMSSTPCRTNGRPGRHEVRNHPPSRCCRRLVSRPCCWPFPRPSGKRCRSRHGCRTGRRPNDQSARSGDHRNGADRHASSRGSEFGQRRLSHSVSCCSSSRSRSISSLCGSCRNTRNSMTHPISHPAKRRCEQTIPARPV